MNSIEKDRLRLLLKASKQLNKKLFFNNLFLSLLVASLITLSIDFLVDFRFYTYFSCIVLFTFICYKLFFKIKFSRLIKRADLNPKYEFNPESDFIFVNLLGYKLKLYFKNCYYYATEDMIFVYHTFKLMAIFRKEYFNPQNKLDDFLSRFKKRKRYNFISFTFGLIIIASLIWKLSLLYLNSKMISSDYAYEVNEIQEGDKKIYSENNLAFLRLTNNKINEDEKFENVSGKIYFRFEHFGKVRLIYNSFQTQQYNVDDSSVPQGLLGLYDYQLDANGIILTNDKFNLKIRKKHL